MQYQICRRRSDPHSVTIHVSQELWLKKAVSWCAPDDQYPKQPSYVVDIFGLDGITEISVNRYYIVVEKSPLFSWKHLLPWVLLSLEIYLDQKDPAEEERPLEKATRRIKEVRAKTNPE
ncbi:MAG: NifU N-terminal domain-containing protein [Candidatus Yanofskybacteria bacterium]|nr:NifU N-terminal domain-containing protein [Candidatus Yanofskybacteria bacterium]